MTTDELIGKLKNHFQIDFYEEFDYIRSGEYEFVISLDEEEQQFSIYREFSFPVHSNLESSSEIMFFELQFIQSLYSVCHMEPEMEYEFAMGCCYDDELVGFFKIDLGNEVIFEYVNWFIDAEYCENDLNYDLLDDLFSDRLESYINQWRIENNRLEHWTNVGWHVYKEKDYDRLGKSITAIVNERGSVVAGVDEECYKEILSSMKIVEYKPIDIYLGLEYAIASEEEECIIWNMNLIRDVMEQIEKWNYTMRMMFHITYLIKIH